MDQAVGKILGVLIKMKKCLICGNDATETLLGRPICSKCHEIYP